MTAVASFSEGVNSVQRASEPVQSASRIVTGTAAYMVMPLRAMYEASPITSIVVVLLLAAALARPATAQNYLTSTGDPSFSAPIPVELGTVDAASGNLHLSIPLGSFPQRGTGQPETISLEYDSSIWTPYTPTTTTLWAANNGPGYHTAGGWYYSFESTGVIYSNEPVQGCWTDITWADQNGTPHSFHLNINFTPGQGCPITADAFATDSSGYHMYSSISGYGYQKVYAPDGTLAYSEGLNDPQGRKIIGEDSNGNYISYYSSNPYVIYDTLGRKVISGTPWVCCSTPITVPTSQGTAQYSLSFSTINVKTNFQQSNVQETSTQITVVRSLTLPDANHSTYYFTYDCDSSSGNAACVSPAGQTAYYGELTGITLPTGGTVNYNYTTFTDAYNNKSQWVSERSSAGGTWNYTPQVLSTCSSTQVGCQQQTTVSAPTGEKTIYTFKLNNGAWPMTTIQKDASGNTLSTTSNTWDMTQSCVLIGCHGNSYIRLLTQQTTVYTPGGSLTKQASYTYDGPQTGNQTAIKEWKYTSSGSFSSVPDRATYISYLTTGTNNINRPLSVTVCSNSGTDSACTGGGSRVSQTLYTYDCYSGAGCTALQPVTGIAQHDDSNFGIGNTQRGNVTSISQWVSGSNYLTSSYAYDTTGQVVTETDPAGNVTHDYYNDSFVTDGGNDTTPGSYSPSTPTNAYRTSVTDVVGTQTVSYYWGSGKPAIAKVYTGATVTNHYQDGLDRQTEEIDPIGWKLATYSSATESDMYTAVGDTSPSVGCVSCQHTEAVLDQWGRASSQIIVNNPLGQVTVGSTYDLSGRLLTQSHPYASLTDPNHVFETFGYDGLGRQVSTTHPDGASRRSAFGATVTLLAGLTAQQGSTASYGSGYPQISQDEAGHQRQQWVDGFGRIIEVDEPGSSSSSASTLATATASIVNGGGAQWITYDFCAPHGSCPQTIPNNGSVALTTNGYTDSAYYGPNGQNSFMSASQVATTLRNSINGDSNSPVTAFVKGSGCSSLVLTAKWPGASGNFPFSTSATYQTQMCGSSPCFSAPVYAMSPSSGSLSGGSGGLSSSSTYTNYIYDVADHLTNVVQGSETRTFAYDGLGRKISETTPEGGTVSYSYTKSGGGLCSGDPSNVCQRTDARNVVSNYAYDSANRLTGISYTIPSGVAAMPNVCTTAGGVSANACYYYGTQANEIGRMTKMSDATGSESYTHDLVGRVTQLTKIVGTQTFTIGYQYNAGGDVTQITYPSGRKVYQAYNNIGQLCQVSPYSSGCGGTGFWAGNLSYNAPGQLTEFSYGNGIAAQFGYWAPRGELTSLRYTSGAQTYFSLNYWYRQNAQNCLNGSAQNNGSIQCITDGLDGGRSINYTYDPLGRLISAQTNGDSAYPKWGLSESYDRYGNRLSQSVTAGSGPSSSLSFSGSNRNQPSGYTYDASGNMTVEPLIPQQNYMTYDGENRMAGYSGNGAANYSYDGNGLRVVKSVQGGTAMVSIFSGSSVIAEYDNGAAPGAPSREYIYNPAGGATTGLLAMISGGATTYYHQDHESVRMTTDGTLGSPTYGQVLSQEGHFPFGEPWYQSGPSNKWFFTSYQRDTETGLDYALARYYDSRTGTFCSADPLAGDPSDPQSWNRYPYGRNDPIDVTDPSGKSWWSSLLIDIGVAVAAAFLPEAIAAIFPAADDVDAAQAALASGNVAESSFVPTFATRGATAAIAGGIGDAAAAGTSFGLSAGLGGAAAAQAAQDADQIPNKLVPKKYQATFNAAYTDALQRLKKPDCANLYGGQGAKIMASTQYEVASIGGPDVGADTVVPGAGGIVRLNSNGPMYDYSPTSKFFKYWKGGFRGGSAVGSVFLLHELGHQLGDVTHFFNPDAGAKNAARNAANTDRVLKNCF
jgi:RHS repeat-associated protein